MSNICTTKYCLMGNKESVSRAYSDLKMLYGGVEARSLCHLLQLITKEDEIISDGRIFDYTIYIDDGKLFFTVDTSWCKNEDLHLLMEKNYPGTECFYLEEEPLEGIFYTNDRTGKGFGVKYKLEYNNGESYTYYKEYADGVKSVVSRFNELFKADCQTMADVRKSAKNFVKNKLGGFFYLTKVKYE